MITRLLIDNSNSRTKFTLAHDTELLGDIRSLPTSALSPGAVGDLLCDWEYDEALLCSVVPTAARILHSAISRPIREISSNTVSPLCKQLLRFYPNKDTLGADRLANAAGLALSSLPCIAADLGTACTFDAVVLRDGFPALLGGVIAPGLRAFTSSLSTATAQLPSIPLPGPSAKIPDTIPTDTRQAILSGCIVGFRGMVEGILRDLCKQLDFLPTIVLTGGDAPFCSSLPFPNLIKDNYLTFKGILRLSL